MNHSRRESFAVFVLALSLFPWASAFEQYQPSTANDSPTHASNSAASDWVDVVAGGKIEGALPPKLFLTVLGDAGGGGVSVDYEVATLLGLKVSKKVLMVAGWRYLDVDYRTSAPALFVYDVHQSGGIAGVTIRLK